MIELNSLKISLESLVNSTYLKVSSFLWQENLPKIRIQIQQVVSLDSKSVFPLILHTCAVVCHSCVLALLWAEELEENSARSGSPNIIDFLAVTLLLKKVVFITSSLFRLPTEDELKLFKWARLTIQWVFGERLFCPPCFANWQHHRWCLNWLIKEKVSSSVKNLSERQL